MTRKKTDRYAYLQSSINVLGNIRNPYQGQYYKALFLCSAGLMRSATAAHVFSAPPFDWNTRTAGTSIAYTMTPVTSGMIEWADDVFCMETEQKAELVALFGKGFIDYHEHKIRVLNIPDKYPYRDQRLIDLLLETVPALVPYAPRLDNGNTQHGSGAWVDGMVGGNSDAARVEGSPLDSEAAS